MSTFIKVNGTWVEAVNFWQKVNGTYVQITEEDALMYLQTHVFMHDSDTAILSIIMPSVIEAETCQCKAYSNGARVTSGVTWNIISGSDYATIDSSTGLLTVSSQADNNTVIVGISYDGATVQKSTTVTYRSGGATETEIIENEDGSYSEINTTVVDNGDGSSTSSSSTTNYDENGNVTGSSTNETINNSDGSSTSTTTNYDENGDPTDTTNIGTDTSGNVSTQDIEYENGEPVVTGYTIDTAENPDGSKTFNSDGVNTEYYAFDLTRGFEIHISWTMDYSKQPTGQNENHHNILTMKRANPSPWYGFQLRQTSTNKNIILGTQFATGSNTNTNIVGNIIDGNTNFREFDLTITYNPLASGTKFTCFDNLNNKSIYTSSLTFPDIDELKYLKVTIGCALDQNGNPYRYSNINVRDFSIQRT